MIICSHYFEFDAFTFNSFKIINPFLHLEHSVNLYPAKILFLNRVEQEFFVKPYYELIKRMNFKKLSYALRKDLFIFLSVQLLRTKEYRLELKDLHEQSLTAIVRDFSNKRIPQDLKIKISNVYSQLEHISHLDTNNFLEYAKYLFNKEDKPVAIAETKPDPDPPRSSAPTQTPPAPVPGGTR